MNFQPYISKVAIATAAKINKICMKKTTFATPVYPRPALLCHVFCLYPILSKVFPFALVCRSLSAFHPLLSRSHMFYPVYTHAFPQLCYATLSSFTHVLPFYLRFSTFILFTHILLRLYPCLPRVNHVSSRSLFTPVYSRFHLFTWCFDPRLSTFLLVYPCLLLFIIVFL